MPTTVFKSLRDVRFTSRKENPSVGQNTKLFWIQSLKEFIANFQGEAVLMGDSHFGKIEGVETFDEFSAKVAELADELGLEIEYGLDPHHHCLTFRLHKAQAAA